MTTNRKSYHFFDVIRLLQQKHDIRIFPKQLSIHILRNGSKEKIFDLGNKSLSKIDYLVNYKHFHILYKDSFK
jgi:hypothetical protein